MSENLYTDVMLTFPHAKGLNLGMLDEERLVVLLEKYIYSHCGPSLEERYRRSYSWLQEQKDIGAKIEEPDFPHPDKGNMTSEDLRTLEVNLAAALCAGMKYLAGALAADSF